MKKKHVLHVFICINHHSDSVMKGEFKIDFSILYIVCCIINGSQGCNL